MKEETKNILFNDIYDKRMGETNGLFFVKSMDGHFAEPSYLKYNYDATTNNNLLTYVRQFFSSKLGLNNNDIFTSDEKKKIAEIFEKHEYSDHDLLNILLYFYGQDYISNTIDTDLLVNDLDVYMTDLINELAIDIASKVVSEKLKFLDKLNEYTIEDFKHDLVENSELFEKIFGDKVSFEDLLSIYSDVIFKIKENVKMMENMDASELLEKSDLSYQEEVEYYDEIDDVPTYNEYAEIVKRNAIDDIHLGVNKLKLNPIEALNNDLSEDISISKMLLHDEGFLGDKNSIKVNIASTLFDYIKKNLGQSKNLINQLATAHFDLDTIYNFLHDFADDYMLENESGIITYFFNNFARKEDGSRYSDDEINMFYEKKEEEFMKQYEEFCVNRSEDSLCDITNYDVDFDHGIMGHKI